MTRDGILNATDPQLDEWVATEVMGWHLAYSLIWQDSRGNTVRRLRMPFPQSINTWHPSTDMTQVMRALMEYVGDEHSWRMQSFVFHQPSPDQRAMGRPPTHVYLYLRGTGRMVADFADVTPERAICKALLLAVLAEKEGADGSD